MHRNDLMELTRKRLSRRHLLATSGAFGTGVAALATFGCGSSSSNKTAGTTGASRSATSKPNVQAGSPQHGGTAHFPITADPPHLDELQVTSFTTSAVWGLVYNGLLQFKLGPGIAPTVLNTELDLATKMENPDPTTYTFHLKDGVKFQDVPPVNGRAMTADDVKWSLDRLKTKSATFTHSYMLDPVTSIQVVDPSTISLKLEKPFAPLLNYLASLYASVTPHEIIDKGGADGFKTKAIGTGPFILKNWQRNAKLQFAANPDYFRSGQPYLGGFEYIVVPTPTQANSLFHTGQLQYVDTEDAVIAKSIRAQSPSAKTATYLTRTGAFGWRFVTAGKPYSDKRVRQALTGAHDRVSGTQHVYGPIGAPSGPLSPVFSQAIPLDKMPFPWDHDVAKAKALLKKTGYGNGFSTTAAVTTSGHGATAGNAGAFYKQNMKQALNIDVSIDDMQYGPFLDALYKPKDPLQRVGWPACHDIDEYFTTLFNYSQAGAETQSFDLHLQALVDGERFAPSKDQRKPAIDKLQTYLADACYVDMDSQAGFASFWSPKLKGFAPNALWTIGWGSQVLRGIWLTT